ncbi:MULTISPECIES: hypothetical protein [unclassified Brenneria]|uniref:hypothetical protein n=1 Tax=unclassified Brenneria TaxID=2634434 RepID=UPI0018F0FF69|nr:hypothetical protein [Brenneria sp. L3-3C-1]MBJ7220435.1 hypothetical protein [Brenneria sp. L3-3C-1]MEE3641679.1 hypothetical protein [Brenneria sp. L3_3C_1]
MNEEIKKSFEYTQPFTANKGEAYFIKSLPWIIGIMTILVVVALLFLWFEYGWSFFRNIQNISFSMVFFLSLCYFILLSIEFFRVCRLKLMTGNMWGKRLID